MNERVPEPLPREWLPEPAAPAGGGDPELWESRLRRIMAAAEPRLTRLQARGNPWWAGLAAWWRPAAAAAVAAAAALLLVLRFAAERPALAPRGSLALSVVATEGEPAALWAGLDGAADPVLALVALEGETQ